MLQEFTAEVERTAKSAVNDIHTALPGEIVSFDGKTAKVQPIGKYVTSDGTSLDYPILTDVPVCFPFCQSSDVGFVFPVKKGDSCIIIISEVELDAWRSGAESEGSLRFDLTNAMAIPGLLELSSAEAVKANKNNAAIIKAGDAEIMVADSGCQVSVGGTVLNVTEGEVSIQGNLTVTGDVKAGAISLKEHTHTDSIGGKTQSPE